MFPQEELELMSEMGDHHIGADILLPRGDQMARGHVVAQSHDANGNIMGRAHANPILDNRVYQVESAGVKFQNKLPMSLLSQCLPRVMQMGMSTYS